MHLNRDAPRAVCVTLILLCLVGFGFGAGQWGFIDTTGSLVVEPQFDTVIGLHGDWFEVNQQGQWGYFDPAARRVAVTPRYTSAGWFFEDRAVVDSGLAHQFCVDGGGRHIFDRKGTLGYGFHEGRLSFGDTTGHFGFLDAEGKVAIKPIFHGADEFHEGLAAVDTGGVADETGYYEGTVSGYIARQGRFVIPPQFDYAGRFSDGRARVRRGDSSFYINRQGRTIIAAQFVDCRDFQEGFAAVRVGSDWGFIDTTGVQVVKPAFSSVGDFSERLAAVRSGAAWGFINTAGELVVPKRFEIGPRPPVFHSGRALVVRSTRTGQSTVKEETGYVNRHGEFWTGEYARYGEFHNGLAPVRVKEK